MNTPSHGSSGQLDGSASVIDDLYNMDDFLPTPLEALGGSNPMASSAHRAPALPGQLNDYARRELNNVSSL